MYFFGSDQLAHLVNPPPSSDTEAEAAGDDWTLMRKYATPWTLSRYIQSNHPIKENEKLKETVTITSARRLYVKFDQDCATQYDYDKLVLFTGVPSK